MQGINSLLQPTVKPKSLLNTYSAINLAKWVPKYCQSQLRMQM